MTAIHLIVKRDHAAYMKKIKTACGRVGWKERNTADEYSTAEGNRFEAAETCRRATCKRCLAKALPQEGKTK